VVAFLDASSIKTGNKFVTAGSGFDSEEDEEVIKLIGLYATAKTVIFYYCRSFAPVMFAMLDNRWALLSLERNKRLPLQQN
jgi:hypothetical protein